LFIPVGAVLCEIGHVTTGVVLSQMNLIRALTSYFLPDFCWNSTENPIFVPLVSHIFILALGILTHFLPYCNLLEVDGETS
jgi:hypothetical protein